MGSHAVNRTEGSASDSIKICSAQSYVKEEKGKLHVAKYSPVIVEHGPIDITIKAITYNKITDKAGNIVERIDVNTSTRESEEQTH